MSDGFLPVIIGFFGLFIGVAGIFVDKGKNAVKAETVRIQEHELSIAQQKEILTGLAELRAKNTTLEARYTAEMNERQILVQDNTSMRSELSQAKALLLESETQVAALTRRVAELEKENTELRAEIEALRKQVNERKA